MPNPISSPSAPPIVIATRGSALALAQAQLVLASCRQEFPQERFELKIIKTTGDKLQTAALAQPDPSIPKGLFTKELETALLEHQADLAVHSLKDLPTDLPAGLVLAAVCKRADPRDVLLYRDAEFLRRERHESAHQTVEWSPGDPVKRGFKFGLTLTDLPPGATVATGSTRRQSQLQSLCPGLRWVPIRGNVGTRLTKLAEQPGIDALLLAAAGLERLGIKISAGGHVRLPPDPRRDALPPETAGDPTTPKTDVPAKWRLPEGLLASRLDVEIMLPCVGQGIIGIEARLGDDRLRPLCRRLDHFITHHCALAERAFLRAMGGGCQSPVAAYAEVRGHQLRLRAVSFRDGPARRGEALRPLREAELLGVQLAAVLSGKSPVAGGA